MFHLSLYLRPGKDQMIFFFTVHITVDAGRLSEILI